MALSTGCPGDPKLGSLMCILLSRTAYCTSRGKHKPGHGTWAQTQTLVCPDGLGMAGPRTLLPSAPLAGEECTDESPRVEIIVGTFRGTSRKLVLVFDGNQKVSDLSLTILFSLPNKLILCNDSVQYKWKKDEDCSYRDAQSTLPYTCVYSALPLRSEFGYILNNWHPGNTVALAHLHGVVHALSKAPIIVYLWRWYFLTQTIELSSDFSLLFSHLLCFSCQI